VSFRDYLFPADHPRLAELRDHDAYTYADAMREHPVAGPAIAGWLNLFESGDFVGITTDGHVIPSLFQPGLDESSPVAGAVSAALELLAGLIEDDVAKLAHPIDSRVWRAWMNPEMYLNRFGLRLEEMEPDARDRVLALVEASLSPEGYRMALDVMRTNAFLGELTRLPRLLNEYSYNVNLFGEPSVSGAWGWQIYGHHLALNCAFVAGQQILTPVFFGAEPNEIDEGPHAGIVMFESRRDAGLNVMRALPPYLAERATVYRQKRDQRMPEGRIHPGDELHLGGAFQDNRVIPFEGLRLAECDDTIRRLAVELVATFLDYQPDGPRRARLNEVEKWLDDSWFCWIGGAGDGDAFYFRLQSPVILVEFDHHAGIFLANTEPLPFHPHTLVRTPNGNDYAAALIRAATNTTHLLDRLA
jgi:hypothetical protein